MKLASTYCYLKPSNLSQEDLQQQQQQNRFSHHYYMREADTNMFNISFKMLKDKENNLGTGDPIFCEQCKAALNKYSRILNPAEYSQFLDHQQKNKIKNEQLENLEKNQQFKEKLKENQLKLKDAKLSDIQEQPLEQELTIKLNIQKNENEENEEIQKKEEKIFEVQELKEEEEKKISDVQEQKIEMQNQKSEFVELSGNERAWVCEFCQHHQKVSFEPEEFPQNDDMVYIVKSVNQVNQEQNYEDSDDITILGCLDNSGSMGITTELQGKMKLKHGFSAEEYENLKQFIEPGAANYQYLPHQNKNTTWVSRKQCVIAALENYIQELVKNKSKKKVGLVSFNNDVVLIGDGMSEPTIITGDKLQKKEEILSIAENLSDKLFTQPITESNKNILKKFESLEENGQTALGPALLASMGLLSKQKPGSMIIMCTDGLANLGLGSFDDNNDETAQQFYEEIGNLAIQKGIVISIITIKGEQCKLEALGKLVEKTNGNITRVESQNLSKDFANIFEDEIVATQVKLQVLLHQGLKFRNEDSQFLDKNQTNFNKEIGNATVNTQISFEYEVKKYSELKEQKINLHDVKEVPFQAQIHYTNINGDLCVRILTQKQKVTTELEQAEMHSYADVMHTTISHKSYQLANNQKLYKEAQGYNKYMNNYMQQSPFINQSQENVIINQQMDQKQNQFRGACYNKSQKQNYSEDYFQTKSMPQQQSYQQQYQYQNIQQQQMQQQQQPQQLMCQQQQMQMPSSMFGVQQPNINNMFLIQQQQQKQEEGALSPKFQACNANEIGQIQQQNEQPFNPFGGDQEEDKILKRYDSDDNLSQHANMSDDEQDVQIIQFKDKKLI